MNDVSRTIVVTGAGSGLGRGLCLELAADGHAILATDKNYETAAETIAMMPSPGTSKAFALDVTSADDVRTFVSQLSGKGVDVLVNNAGLQCVAPVDEFPSEKWHELIDVILNGSFAMVQALLPGMRRQGYGRILNVGSINSLVASPYKAAYVAAKHALVGLSKVVALETADADITVNTICPAYIRTPLVDAQISDQAKARGITEDEVINKILLNPMPKKAFISIEEVAGAVRYLMSRQARNITGQTLVIDGGWTAH